MSRILGLLGASLVLISGAGRADDGVGCVLSSGAYANRMEEVQDLFAGNQETRELADGYEFRFPGDGDWGARLLALIDSERQCCQSFRFELSFEPQQGPIWFRVRGSKEVKAFLETLLVQPS